MQINLAYGQSGLLVDLPDSAVVVEPLFRKGLADEKVSIRKALQNPLESPPLADLVNSSDTVAISVCDITRPMPSNRVLPVLLNELRHVPSDQISILIATGTHRICSREELIRILGENIVNQYRVINHNSTDRESLKECGKWGEGFPVFLNRVFVESDKRITVGFVEPHFFAGFSGGPKMVAPGLAGLETVMDLHSARLIAHPSSTWGLLDENPIHGAIREIAAKIGVSFSIDVTLNNYHEITGVYAGNPDVEHRMACREVKMTSMQKLVEAFDIVVTTNSGFPLDLNLYQSVKGMSAAARIVKPHGVIICAAECRDGIPDHGAYGEILRSVQKPDQILEMVFSPAFYRRDQWQAQIQAMIQQKAQVFVKSSYLTHEQIRAALFEPVDDIGELVRELVIRNKGKSSICILPQGPQTIPYLETEQI